MSDYELRYLNTKLNDVSVDTQPARIVLFFQIFTIRRLIVPNIYCTGRDREKTHESCCRSGHRRLGKPNSLFLKFHKRNAGVRKKTEKKLFPSQNFYFFFSSFSLREATIVFLNVGDKKKQNRSQLKFFIRFLCLRCGFMPHTIFLLCNNLSEAFSVVKYSNIRVIPNENLFQATQAALS